jgi:protein dithiol oxidoreductase (disulfide-forming)
MNRREFSAAAACVMGAAALGWPGLALSQQALQEGKDYRKLDRPLPVDVPAGKIEVIEFFWYSCPHCNAFEPLLVDWIKKLPADVVVKRVPVAFRDEAVPQQRLFYSLDAIGKVDALHQKVFDAVHKDKQPTDKQEGILQFAQKNGLDPAKFQEVYNSMGVSSRARRASVLMDAYGVEGVPAIGVAGRFYTDSTLSGGMERMLRVTDHLVAEARKAK